MPQSDEEIESGLSGLDPADIDAAVRERVGAGESLYGLDRDLLEELAVDLIVTQQVCEVCAVSSDDVRAIAARLPTRPRVLSLDPATLPEVLAEAETLGEAAGATGAGERLRRKLTERIEAVRRATSAAERRPTVLALEWLDPPYSGGHWIPEMIAAAGGEDALGTGPGERSRVVDWAELEAAGADVAIVMPCGLYAEEAAAEARRHRRRLRSLAPRIHAVDAASSFSRPGPRLADGVELLGHLLHPELAPAPPGLDHRPIA